MIVFRSAIFRRTFFRQHFFVTQFFVPHFFVVKYFRHAFVRPDIFPSMQFSVRTFLRLQFFSSHQLFVYAYFRLRIFFVRRVFVGVFFRLGIYSSEYFSLVHYFDYTFIGPSRFSYCYKSVSSFFKIEVKRRRRKNACTKKWMDVKYGERKKG